MNGVSVRVRILGESLSRVIVYARVPVIGDVVQVPGEGADKKVVKVCLLPFDAESYNAEILVEDH